jgi:homoserine O-acetyltransferase
MAVSPNSFAQGDLQDQKVAGYKSPLGVIHLHTVALPDFRTESGFTFEKIDVSYQTLGKLSPARDNAILVCHALSGSAHVAGLHPETGRPGWWDYHIGPGLAVDTNKYFVICANVLGGCSGTTGPTSVDPRTGKSYGVSFPFVTVRDMVAVQAKLLDHLGIEKLFAVVGGSMGGMQALAWTTDFPGRVQNCVAIATCLSHGAMQIAFNEIGRQAILTDPNWHGGNYSETHSPAHGLSVARMVGHVTYLSEFSMTNKFGRHRQPGTGTGDKEQFSVASYLHHQGESFVKRFDPNSYLYLTHALDRFDLFEGKVPDTILKRIRARFLVVSFASDWLYPPAQSRELVRLLKRANIPVTYVNLDTEYGHDSFLIENPPFASLVRDFLENGLAAAHHHASAARQEPPAAN